MLGCAKLGFGSYFSESEKLFFVGLCILLITFINYLTISLLSEFDGLLIGWVIWIKLVCVLTGRI